MRPERGAATAAAPVRLPRLPIAAERLFGHYEPGALDPCSTAPFMIGRLLEDGDGADLRWLAKAFTETELAAWLVRHGSRALSNRSLAFWQVVLSEAPALPEREGFDSSSRSSRASLAPGGAAVGEGGRDLWPL